MLQLDIPIIIKRLTESGLTTSEIAKETGLNASVVNKLMSEIMQIPESWNHCASLLDLYFRFVPNKTLPIMYEHNE